MANTTYLNLEKLTGSDKLKTFPTTFNDDMDIIDSAVNDRMVKAWTAGNSATGAVVKALPSSYSEVEIIVRGTTYVNAVFRFSYAMLSQLTGNTVFVNRAQADGYVALIVNSSNFVISSVKDTDGTDITATSTIALYYR